MPSNIIMADAKGGQVFVDNAFLTYKSETVTIPSNYVGNASGIRSYLMGLTSLSDSFSGFSIVDVPESYINNEIPVMCIHPVDFNNSFYYRYRNGIMNKYYGAGINTSYDATLKAGRKVTVYSCKFTVPTA